MQPEQPAPKSDPSSPSAETPARPGLIQWVIDQQENILTIVVALGLAVGIRTFIAEPRWIPSESMVPTLKIGDRLVVEKVSYRFRDPQRGEIIVFNPPISNPIGAYIKRVIGLPGDRIRIHQGKVIVNGVPLQEPYIAEPPNYECPSSDCFAKTGSEFTVPPKSYFVMGDNRNDSQDSHIWGFLPRENIIGHTLFRFWPLNHLGKFEEVQY